MSVAKLKEQDDLVADVKAILTLLKEREWAEHCTKSRPGRELESLITDMHNEIAELQQKLDAMAAESAALKSGVTYFACGSEYGFDLFKDKKSAIDTCLEEIELHREGYFDGDGWGDEVRKTAWGIVVQSAQGRDAQGLHTSDSQHTYQTCNYRLEDEVKTPATDAYLNSVRAEGAQMCIDALVKSDDDDFTDAPNICVSVMHALRSGTHDTASNRIKGNCSFCNGHAFVQELDDNEGWEDVKCQNCDSEGNETDYVTHDTADKAG